MERSVRGVFVATITVFTLRVSITWSNLMVYVLTFLRSGRTHTFVVFWDIQCDP